MSYRIGDLKASNAIVFQSLFAKSVITDDLVTKLSLRIPRLTTSEKNTLSGQNGLIVYDTDLDDVQAFSQGAWGSLTSGSINTGGLATFTNTTQSTGTDSGALVVSGGVGISKDLNMGGILTVNGTALFDNPLDSMDSMSGALVVTGGVGIEKSLYVGGNLGITGDTTLSGALSVDNISLDTLNTTGVVNINDASQSIDEMSGALVVDGGVGIAKNLNIGGELNVTGKSTFGGDVLISSCSTCTALVVDGGTNLQGDLVVDDNISFGGRMNGRVRVSASSTNLDNDFILNVTALATITLPDLSVSSYTGVTYHIIKDTTADVIVNTAVPADKIINAGVELTTITLDGPIHERATFVSNGVRWYLM
jgi:hypothetical protein